MTSLSILLNSRKNKKKTIQIVKNIDVVCDCCVANSQYLLLAVIRFLRSIESLKLLL